MRPFIRAGAVLLALCTTVCFAENITPKTDQIIVKYKDGPATPVALAYIASQQLGVGISVKRYLNPQVAILRLDQKKSVAEIQQVTEELAKNANVEYIEPDLIMQIQITPNDTRFSEQWNLYEQTAGLNATLGWDYTQGLSDIVVAVVDTGIYEHPELKGRILAGYDFITDTKMANDGNGRDADPKDPGDFILAGECDGINPPIDINSSWHGTLVSGVIAAKGNNSTDLAGLGWNVKILPARALGKCGGYTSDIVDAMRWAAGLSVSGVTANPTPARVINLSLGVIASCGRTYQDTINEITQKGAAVVTAAGNNEIDMADFSPANCNGTFRVVAAHRGGGKASYSNYGSLATIAAPGGEMGISSADGILTTSNSGTKQPSTATLKFTQGTSLAAPHLSGTLALMLSAHPDISLSEMKTIITSQAKKFPSGATAACSASICGAGLLNTGASVKNAHELSVQGIPDGSHVLKNRTGKSGLAATSGKTLRFTIEVPSGVSQLKIYGQGGLGDSDLYVKREALASPAQYDWLSDKFGNNETITISRPVAGLYHVSLHGYFEFNQVTLTAEW